MDKQEIIEGNKLIAEFMGFFVDGFNGSYNFVRKDETRKGMDWEFRLQEAKYHSSWDWLKPCIDKIHTYGLAYPEQVRWVSDMKIVVDLQPCWREVVHFIKWLNSQKQ